MLKRVSIQNFKSLKDVTLDLQKVNLLIGPNNSGKTNFLKALEFCYDAHEFGEEKVIINEDDLDQQILYQNRHFVKSAYDYSRLVFKKTGNFKILIDILFNDAKFNLEWSSAFSNIKYEPKNYKFLDIENRIKAIKDQLGNIFIYKPDPNKLNKPSPVGRGEDLVTADASNLIAFFDRIRDEYPASFAQIKADLSKCVPEFIEINFQNIESAPELVKQFGDKTFKRIGLTDGRQKTIYWADELSEGTLYFIALLCIINQPNPPKLLLLEEPEKGIHPRRIREVMDFIFRLAEEKNVQIILTSHNEHVLDDFATRPESVFVFDKDEEGATYVRNLQRDIIEPTNQRNRELGLDEIDLTTNLSENWLYGLLGGVPSIP